MKLRYWDYETDSFLSLDDYVELKYERALAKALKATRLPKNATTVELIAQKAMEAVKGQDEINGSSLVLIDDEVMAAMKLVEKDMGVEL